MDGRVLFETEPDADRPWLGVLLTTTDDGVEINSVMDGSPADRAGLQVGDLIVRVDDRDLTDSSTRGGLLDDKEPGDRIRFTVLRDGKEETLRTKLDSHPGRVEFEIDEEMGAFGMAGNALGLLLDESEGRRTGAVAADLNWHLFTPTVIDVLSEL